MLLTHPATLGKTGAIYILLDQPEASCLRSQTRFARTLLAVQTEILQRSATPRPIETSASTQKDEHREDKYPQVDVTTPVSAAEDSQHECPPGAVAPSVAPATVTSPPRRGRRPPWEPRAQDSVFRNRSRPSGPSYGLSCAPAELRDFHHGLLSPNMAARPEVSKKMVLGSGTGAARGVAAMLRFIPMKSPAEDTVSNRSVIVSPACIMMSFRTKVSLEARLVSARDESWMPVPIPLISRLKLTSRPICRASHTFGLSPVW